MVPTEVQLTPDLLVVLYGILQSFFFEYVPGVSPWYAKQGDVEKRAIQALGVLVVGLLVLLGSCLKLYEGLACTGADLPQSLLTVFTVWFTAMVANQTTHAVFKKSKKE